MARRLIIAIDGPSGAGKSTLGRMLARKLGLLYIDTGSMYRAVALAVIESTVNETDDVAVGSLAERVDIDLAGEPDSLTLFVRDSGRGFNPDAVKERGGLGLISMRQRAELIGGTLEVQSGFGQGTQIVVCAPLKRCTAVTEN